MAELIPGAVKRGYLAVTTPLVRALVDGRVSPNTLTTIGAALIILSAVAYGQGAIRSGGLLLLLSGLVDTLDGQVARMGARTTAFGAFYDSTLDRVGDGAAFIGIGAWFIHAPDAHWRLEAAIACMAAILVIQLVSYMRARAEGLGLECKVGIAQRAERIIGLGLPTAVLGAGSGGIVLLLATLFITLISLITVGQRFAHVYRVTRGAGAS